MSIKKNIIISLLERRVRRIVYATESQSMSMIKLNKLSELEKRQVSDLWGHKDYKYHEMFKTLVRFDARWVSDYDFQPRILRALNPMDMGRALENKSLYPILFKEIPQPKAIVNQVGGVYIVDGKIVTKEQAIERLWKSDRFVIKPTHDSICGNKVMLIEPKKDNVESTIEQFGGDFIAQEVVRQSDLTAVFHPSSLNTFRITTLNINGNATLCNILFRCGQGDAVVDNGKAGGLMCGVSPEGLFHEIAFDKYYQKYQATQDGKSFAGHTIPQMSHIVEQVLGWHSELLPHIGIAGWDIALDENNTPVMIEMNLRTPGIQFEQICASAPLFGERTEEVIQYVKSHQLGLMDVCSI